jgi:Tol biopolymer transport system component
MAVGLLPPLDGTVQLWDAASGAALQCLNGHKGWVYDIVFSPDGHWIATASYDRTVRLWDADSGQGTRTLEGHTDGVVGVAISPDGHRLASTGLDGKVRVWDTATGQQTFDLKGYMGSAHTRAPAYRPAFSPDGQRLAAATGDNDVTVWDSFTGKEVLICKGHTSRVFGVAYSPDGKHLASAGNDQTVRVWDAATGKQIRRLQMYSGSVLCVAFSPDGRRLAAAGGDPTVRLWDWATGQELLALKGHAGAVFGMAISLDGRRLASASMDGTVKVWDATALTPEARLECEARGLVQWLFEGAPLPALPVAGTGTVGFLASLQGQGPWLAASSLLHGRAPLAQEVAAAVKRDPTITEPVRRRALAWVEPLGRIRLRAEAGHLVVPLFAKLLLRCEVVAALRADVRLSRSVRQEALALAETFPENAYALNEASWAVVRKPGADAAAYQRALRHAEAACGLQPKASNYRNTLGVAQYRAGRYRQALDTLQPEPLHSKTNGSSPDDLAFLAMAQHRLGKAVDAQATLVRLRKVMQQPEWAGNVEAQGFLREAEGLLKTNPGAGNRP